MTVSLGTLEIGLGLITTQYDTGIARAKGQLVSLQRMAARSGVTVKIGVKVDDRPLYQLNDHLKLKRDDLDKTSDHYRRNPIRVFVEDRQLVSLNQQLRELKRVSVDIKVPSRLVVEHRFSGYQDKVEKEIERSTSRLASEIRKSYSRGGIVGAASRLVTGVIALPFKATATVLRDVVRGYFERIGQEFSNTWAVEPSRNAARKITIAIKKIDRYLLGQNQVLETYLSELTRSGSTEKAFNAAFKRTNVNQVIERFKTLQEIATVPASKTKERLRLIQKDPELSKILKQSTEEIQKQYAGQGLSKAEIANLSMQRFLENAQPQTKVVNILNSFLKEISPFLRFVQGMKDYRTSLEAQKIYSERKAGFPKLKEGEDVVSVIGGAQFRGGQGGRKVAMSLEPLAPQKRFIPVENPETDTDLENERPAEKQFKAFISRNLPFLEGEEILNTLINAFRQISSSLDVFTPSTAAAQALANTMLAQEQGRKGNAVSYSLGGVDNIQYARTAQFMGVKDTQALAIAYPFVDITQSTPKNFTASMLTSDPLGFVKLLGIGNKTNQFMGIESTNPYGSANHHQKHLFKNIEFINKFFATINANIPDLSPGKISAIVEAGDKLYELIGSMNQIESVLSTGEFNTDLPFHRFLQGYDGQTTKSNVLDLVLEMMQDNFAIEAFKDVEGAEEFYAKLRNQFDKIASQFKEKFQASGVNLPENLARDFAGFLKYQEVAEGYNKSMTEFQTGKVSEKPSWWAGNLDPNTVKQRTGKLQTETIPWFRKEGSKFGSYQDALIEMFTLIDKVTKEYVSRGGNLSDETRQNLKFFPTETIPSEINAFLGKSFPTKNLPKEEIVRDLNLQFPEYTASTSNLTALQKIDYEAEKQRVTKLFRNRQAAILAYNKLITELTAEIVPSIDKIKAIGTGFPELGMHGSFAFLTDEFVYKTDIDPEGVNKKIATPNELETYKQLQGRLSPLLYKAVPDKAIVTERIQGKTLKEILTRIAQPFKKVQKQLADATLALDKVTKEGNEAEIERLNKEITSLEKTAQKEKTRFNKAATILYKQVGQLNSALQKMGVVHNDLAETNVFFSPQGIRAIDFGGSQVNPTAAQKIEDKKTVIDRMMGNNQYKGLMDKTAVAGAILSGFQSPLPIPEKRTVDPEKLKQTTPGQLIELGSTNPTLLQQYGEKITYPKTKPFSIPPKQEKVTTPKTEKLNPTVFLEQSLTRNTDRTITALNSIEQALNEIKKGILAKYASPLIDPWQNSTPDPWAKSNAELMRVFVDAINKVSSQKLLPPAPDDFGSSETDRGNSPLEKILEDISIKAQAGLKSALTTRLSTPDSSGEIQLLTGQENISELLNQVLIREVKEAGRILGNALKDASLDVVKFGQIVFTVLKAIERPVMAIPGVGLGKKALQVGGTAAIGASALHALPMGLDATIVNEMRSILAGAMSAGGREMIQAVATQMTQAFSGLPFGVGQQLTEAVMNLVTELTNGTISVLAQGGAVAGSALMAGEGVKKLLGAATSSVPKLIDKEEQQKIEGKTQKLLKAAKDKAGSLITTEITPYFDEKAFPVSSPIPANIKAINPKYYTVKQLRGLARDQGIDVPASGLGARKEEIWKSLIEKFNPDQLTRLLLTTKASDRTKLGKKELSGFQVETTEIPADFTKRIGIGIKNIGQEINTTKDIQSLERLYFQLEKVKKGIASLRANPEFNTTSINKSLSGFLQSVDNLQTQILAKGGLESGKNLNEGLAKGLKDNDAEKIVRKNARNIIDGLNDELGNRSPSWKGEKAGRYLIQGVGIGIEKEESRLTTKIKELTTKVIKELQSGMPVNAQQFIQTESFKGVTINPATTGSANKPIENNWEKTEKSVRENIQEIATEAKKHSKDIQRGLSEASPGPTWNIRKNWRVTAEYVSVQIRQIAQEAEQAKARIDKAGLAGFTFKPFTPSLPKASPPLPLLLPSSPAPSIRTERENQRQQRISAPAPSNRIIPAFGASPYSFGEYLASLVQKAEQAIYRQTLSGGGGGNQPPKPPRIASPASPEPEPPKREKFDVSKEAERVLEDIQKARAILQKQESLLNQTLKAAKPQKSTREKILEDWNQKRDNIFKALDSVEKAGVSSGFTDGIVTGLKTAIAQADGFINFLSVGGKALRTLDKELDAATGGMINLRKASLAVIGGFALFKTAEFLLEPLFFAIQDLPFRVQQAVTDSLLAFTELQQIRINLDIAGVNNVDTAIDGLRNRADELGISFRESTKQYAQFQIVTTGSPLQAQGDDIFEGFQSALAVRQTNPQQQTETFRAINQMAARSVLSVEEFTQQLTESGGLYDALIVAARAMGMTTAEFYRQASAGQLLSQDVIPRLAAEYERLSAGGIGASSKTLQAEMNRYQNNIEQLSMSTGEKLGVVAYPALQLLNTLLKGLNDNLGLVATVSASAVIATIGLLGKSVLQFSAATRLGQGLIASYNASLFAMGVTAGQTTTKMQMLSATAKVAGEVLKATIGAMIVPAATIVALQTFYDIFENGDANLKNSLQTLKESRKVLEDLGKIEPENKNKNLWNKFFPDMNLSGTEKFFNVLTVGTVYTFKRNNAVRDQQENLKNIREGAKGLETNLKTYQTVLSDTAGIDKFIDSLQGLRNSLAQVRAERAIATNKEDFAAVARLNEREQELMKQEQEAIDRRLGSVGSRITADLQVAEATLAALEEEYQKSGGTLKNYGARSEHLKGIIAGLKAEQQNYLNVLRDQEKEYKKLQYAFNRTLNAQENRNFINARQSLNRQIGNELAFASGQLNEYEFNVKVHEESLQTAKEKFASLQTTASETGAKLSSRITEAADKTLSTYFKDDLKRLGVGNFSEAIARNLLSPEAIERVMSENSGDLESNAALKNILEMAKTYATTRQEILQSEKEIQSINREIITERKRRQLSEKQAANEILIAGQQEKLYSSTPTGKLRSLQPAETRVSLEELYKQLAVEQERLAANVDDPLQIRSNIARIKTNIARTRLTLRDQQNDLVEFYTTTAIEIEATNKQIGLTARTASNQVKTFARDQTLIEISKLYKQLAFEQSKLVGTLKGDPLEVKANIARIQLQIEQAKLSLRDQTTDIEDYYTGLQRQVVDLRVSIEDYQIQSAREVRGFKEAYGDMIRGLQRSLIEAENEFRASQRSLENQRLQVSMLSGRTPGVSSLQKQLDDLILQYRDEIASIQGEADSLRTRPLDIRDQSIQFARQLRDIQEQIYDAERNRLKQLRDFWMQQVQIVRELSQQQLTFKSLNEIWAGILENSKKLLAKSGKIAGGKVPNVALAIGEAPNNSESSEQYRQGTSNNPRTLQRGDYIDYGNGRIYKYDPSPNYDPKTMRYRSPVNADEIRHPSVVQQVGTSGSEEFDRLLMRSGLYKNWEGFTREVLNPNLQPLTPEERANYNAGNVGRYSGVLTGQPQANIPLTPLPTFDYDRARELDTQIRITREKTLQNQKEENLLKLERARRENLDRIAGLIQQTQEARIQAEIGLRDTGDTSTDLMRSSKGYLTFSEKIEQARRNGSREIEKQRESIQSQIRSLDQLTSDFAKNSEETRARLFQDTGNDDAFKALEAENKRNTAILEGYKALDNQLSVYGQIRGEAAAMRMIEDERVAALERYNNLIADGIDAGNRMNPLGTLFSAGEAQKLRIEADFARRRLELQRYAQEGALSPTQLFEMSAALDKMQQANLASAFIEANPAVGAFGDLLRVAFTGGRDTLQQMLNVLTSFLQKIGEMAANQLLMQIFGGRGGGGASSLAPSGGGGLLGGAISLFTGSLGGVGSSAASTPFTSASNFSLGTGFSLFSSGGKIGADAPIEKNVISAFQRERSMSGGRNPRLIVANEDEYVIPANEAKSYLEYKNAPIKNYASGGFVGGTGYSVTTSNNNSSNQSLSITNVSNVTIESRNDMGYSLTQLKERENAQNERTKRRFFG